MTSHPLRRIAALTALAAAGLLAVSACTPDDAKSGSTGAPASTTAPASPTAGADESGSPAANPEGGDPQLFADAVTATFKAMQQVGLTQSVASYTKTGATESGQCLTSAVKGRGSEAEGVDTRTVTAVMAQPSTDLTAMCAEGSVPTAQVLVIVMGSQAWVTRDGTTYLPATLSTAAVKQSAAGIWDADPATVVNKLASSGALRATGANEYTITISSVGDLVSAIELMGRTVDRSMLAAVTDVGGSMEFVLADGRLQQSSGQYWLESGTTKVESTVANGFDYSPVQVTKPDHVTGTPTEVDSLEQLATLGAGS